MTQQRAVVDSSGWIELFTNGPLADRFLALLEAEENLVVPAISILEVFKWVLREHSEAQAIQAAAVMHCGSPWPTSSSWPLPVPIRPGFTR